MSGALIAFCANAQKDIFTPATSIPVTVNGINLSNAWSGGLNAVIVNTLDLDNDSVEDLIIFDRTSNKISTFLLKNGKQIYAPQYENYFPKIKFWLVLADYDCDGKKDIFTVGLFASSIGVYKNTSNTNIPSWQLITDGLTTSLAGGNMIEIECSPTDFPAITDIDDDGDMDIVSYDGLGKSALCLYLNRSKEQSGNCENLNYEKYSACYGKFTIGFNCNSLVSLNQNCPGFGGTNDNARLLHNGSAITVKDLNSDGKKDILLGDVGCTNLNALYNNGTNTNAFVNTVNHSFPSSYPVNIHNFPVSFFGNYDDDLNEDLLVSPSILENDDNLSDFQNSLWMYKNMGTNALPNYSLTGKNFLQNESIDIGERTFPALADYDFDGDLDLFVSNHGLMTNGKLVSTVYLFENIGDKDSAQFVLINEDYLNLSKFKFADLSIGFANVDENESQDLYFLAIDTLDNGTIYYIPNTNNKSQPFNLNNENLHFLNITAFRLPPDNFQITNTFTKFDYIHIFTYKSERKLLFGTKDGPIQLYKNTFVDGKPNFTFEKDKLLNTTDEDYDKLAVKAITHLKSNDSLAIYTIDNSGEIVIYNLNSLLGLDFKVSKSISYNNENKTAQPTKLGTGISLALADLNNDTLPDLILGTKGGGLLHFKNVSKKTLVTSLPTTKFSDPKSYKWYPNPANAEITIESKNEMIVEIFDLLGNGRGVYHKNAGNPELTIDLTNFLAGIYQIKISNKNSTYFEKLIIQK